MTKYYQYDDRHPNYDFYYKIQGQRIRLYYGSRPGYAYRQAHYWQCQNPSALEVTVEANADGSGCVSIAGLDGFQNVQKFNIYQYAQGFAMEVKKTLGDISD